MGYCALVVCLVWSSLFFVIAGIGSVFYSVASCLGVGGWGGGGSLSGFGGRFFLGFRCFGAFL